MNSDFNDFKQRKIRSQKGGVLVLVAICLIVFISLAALAIDVGYLFVGRNELQNAADAAALGGTRKLGKIYQTMAEAGQNLTGYNVADSGDKTLIIAVTKEVAAQNKAASEGIIIDEAKGDIQIGVWDPNSDPKFTETDDLPDAVRVTAHRDTNNTTGEITTFFASIFGIDSAPVSAIATAELSPQGTSEPGELEIPIGLSEKWFHDDTGAEKDYCGDIVKFHPTNDVDACAGWTSFNQEKNNGTLLPATSGSMNNILDGSAQPSTSTGDTIAFNNGVVVADLFKNLLMKFGDEGYDVDSIYDSDTNPQPLEVNFPAVPLCLYNTSSLLQECNAGDVILDNNAAYDASHIHQRYPLPNDSGNSGKFTGAFRYAHEWETTVPVYAADNLTDNSSCTPGTEIIKGYAKVVLYDVGGPSDPYIYARVSCDVASPKPTRGGGAYFGVMGTIPGLVE